MDDRTAVFGAVYPDDAWVEDDVAALVADFRSYTANQVTAWHALTLLGLGDRWRGPGSRLRLEAAAARP